MWPEQDQAWGQGGPELWGRMGLFLWSAFAVRAQGAPGPQPAPHSHPAVLGAAENVLLESSPAHRPWPRHRQWGAGGPSLRQTQPGPLLFLGQTAQGRSRAGRGVGVGAAVCGRARGVLRPSMPWVRQPPLSLPLQPWLGVPPFLPQPPEWSPVWHLHLRSLRPSLGLPKLLPVVSVQEGQGKRGESG